MSPEMLIAIVSAVSGLLLVLGGVLLGRGFSGGEAERTSEIQGDLEIVRKQLREAERDVGEARRKAQVELHDAQSDFEKRIGLLQREHDKQIASVRQELATARAGAAGSSPDGARQTVAQLQVMQKERDEAVAKLMQMEARASRPSMAGGSAGLDRELKGTREELERLRGELQAQDKRIQQLQQSLEKESADKERFAKERDEAREKQEAVERIMDGVRARSTMLNQQLKDVQAELARHKS